MTLSWLIIVAVIIVAWLTAAATSVRSVSRIWLRHWVERGGRGSTGALAYLERPLRLLLAAGTAVALTAVATGVIIGSMSSPGPLSDIGRAFGTAVILLFLGQLLPRAIARRWPGRLLPVLVPVLRAVDFVLGPTVAAVRRLVQRADRSHPVPDEQPRDALESLLREGELEGVSAGEEAAIISGVVQFGDKMAQDVMTPREDIFAVDVSLPSDELARRVASSGYSRVPVYEGTLDNPVGMVHVFDLIKAAGGRSVAWRPLAHTAPETFCNELLASMLRGQRHLAIVRSAEGRTLGLVTLEDLLEELVGDIRDEHDEPPASQSPSAASAPVSPRGRAS